MENLQVKKINEKKLFLEKELILKKAEIIYSQKLIFIEKILNNEIDIDKKEFIKRIGGFGGKISGLTRQLKESLILSLIEMLVANNDDFKALSVREVRIFLKTVLDVATSQKNLKDFNFEHLKNDNYLLVDFQEMIENKAKTGKYNELLNCFNNYYESLRTEMKNLASESKEKQNEVIKKLTK